MFKCNICKNIHTPECKECCMYEAVFTMSFSLLDCGVKCETCEIGKRKKNEFEERK